MPYQGDDRELVLRSVLALKLLTFSPTGAMAAAATTSLPERVGGDRNYDYRYGWIRDTSFVLDSFIRLGLTQEVQGTLAWMLSCISGTAPEIHPFYGLSGHVPDEETELRLRGYRDSSPARGGNRTELAEGPLLWREGLSHLSLLNAAALLDEQRVDDGQEQAE